MRTVLMVALLMAGGCGKKEIERLEGLLSVAQETIASREADATALRSTVSGLEADIAGLREQIAQKETELAALDADLAAERERSARMLADRGALRAELDQMQKAMAELAERKRQAEARVKAFRDLVSRFQSLIDAGTLDVRIIDGRMVVVLATDVLFASGSADLSDGGKGALTQVAQILGGMADRRFQVEGHTDNVPISTSRFPNNWYLAAARAIGVVDHLTKNGMTSSQVSAASFGDTRPVASNEDKELRAANRRIEIVIVPDLSDMPGYAELKAADEGR
jgi:chemotaxis protein MotB